MSKFKLENLKSKAAKRNRKRLGRGSGSGTGTYAGRGMKGQKARSGGSIRPGFEGGRMPLIRQLPKLRGFKSLKPNSQPVSLSQLNDKFADGQEVNMSTLEQMHLIDKRFPVKILGSGKIEKKLTIKGVPVSAGAKKAVEKAGGTVIETKQEIQENV